MAEIVDNLERTRFEMKVEDQVAFVTYLRSEGRLHLLHAEVPHALRGRGAGSDLVRGVLDHVRGEGVVVVPDCPFVADFIEAHPEYQELTREGSGG